MMTQRHLYAQILKFLTIPTVPVYVLGALLSQRVPACRLCTIIILAQLLERQLHRLYRSQNIHQLSQPQRDLTDIEDHPPSLLFTSSCDEGRWRNGESNRTTVVSEWLHPAAG